MKVLPAIDLRHGACVQLVGGELDAERIHLPDPVEVARGFLKAGFRSLHVVDLDAAADTGSNAAIVARLLKLPGTLTQVGGGVRDEESIERLLDLGATRVMVGTRALEEPSWLEEVAFRYPDQLVLAADTRGRQVVTRGWTRTLTQDVAALVASSDHLPLAGILVTAVHVEGKEGGTDQALMSELVALTRHPLYAAGGIASMEELGQLATAGVAAAVLGMALYTGKLDPAAVAKAFP